jgi:hypothetical protein
LVDNRLLCVFDPIHVGCSLSLLSQGHHNKGSSLAVPTHGDLTRC